MLSHLRPAIVMLLAMTLLTGLAYPFAITGIGQLILNRPAEGSLVRSGDNILGSTLIGQAWTSDKYFWGRPSAAGDGYNAAASSGSNLGPTSQKLMDRIKSSVETMPGIAVPADAVTTSGSGLDPHISPEFALLQIARVATARGLSEEQVKGVVEANVERPLIGLFGEPRVNVLLLNLALDGLNSAANG